MPIIDQTRDEVTLHRLETVAYRYDAADGLQARFHYANGLSLFTVGEIEEALVELAKVEQFGSKKSPRMQFGALQMMATLHQLAGDHDKSTHTATQSLNLAVKLLGNDHPDVVDALETAVEVFEAAGRFEEAREFETRAEQFWTRPRGQELSQARYPDPETGQRTVRGRVVDRRGRPVAGAAVTLGNELEGNGKYALRSHTREETLKRVLRRVQSGWRWSFRVSRCRRPTHVCNRRVEQWEVVSHSAR